MAEPWAVRLAGGEKLVFLVGPVASMFFEGLPQSGLQPQPLPLSSPWPGEHGLEREPRQQLEPLAPFRWGYILHCVIVTLEVPEDI